MYHLLFVDRHVVTQIIETQLIVGNVGNITVVSFLSLVRNSSDLKPRHRQSQESVNLSHPLCISLCQIVVDRNDMYTLSFQRI